MRVAETMSVERKALGGWLKTAWSSDVEVPAHEKAGCPVRASPRIRVWMSCVPSYV